MTARPTVCDPLAIELFLDGRLDEEQQRVLERHLDECDACCHLLRDATAASDDWEEVSKSLNSAMIPGSGSDSNSPPSESPDSGQGASITLRQILGPSDDPRMLGRFAGYEIAGVIGCGGMGVVLKGFDRALNRYAAIKILAPHLATSGAARKRFAREAQAAAAVTHPNVIAIHGVAEWNDLPYLVMPYVRGESLQKRIDRGGPQGVQEILRVGRQIAAGLAAAHAQGLVHRDIKPANVLLEDGIERLQITDFGLARAIDDASVTRTGVIAGTPHYMSPEQARGELIDARSDLFSLGSVLYTMAAGHPPFRAETSYGILRRITDNEPRPIREINPDLPSWLAWIIGRLHAKCVDDRFESAGVVANLLEQCLAHVQHPTAVPLPRQCQREVVSREPDASRAPTRRRVAIVLLSATFLIVALCAGSFFLPKHPIQQDSTFAVTEPVGTISLPTQRDELGAASHWDATASEIEQFVDDLRAFEERAERPWDEPLVPQRKTDLESSFPSD